MTEIKQDGDASSAAETPKGTSSEDVNMEGELLLSQAPLDGAHQWDHEEDRGIVESSEAEEFEEFFDHDAGLQGDTPAVGAKAQSLLPFEESLNLEGQVEAILFASPKPLKIQDIYDILRDDEGTVTAKDIDGVVGGLVKLYEERAGGFTLVHEAGVGYQFQTVAAASQLMEMMFSMRPRPLSRAALETLSIIAYRQPATRAEIEFIRGVDAGSIIKNLMDRNLIECVGRKEDSGRPMLFGTTREFLKVFKLDDLADLPPLASFQPSHETTEAAKLQATDEVDVEGLIGDESQNIADLSAGLDTSDVAIVEASDLGSEENPEAAGPSARKELEPQDSFEFEFEDETSKKDMVGASYDGEEDLERDYGGRENTKVDLATGVGLPPRSGKVDSGRESES